MSTSPAQQPDLHPLSTTFGAVPCAAESDLEDAMAERLGVSDRFRILRRLVSRPVRPDCLPPCEGGRRIGIILDTETTGLNPDEAELIEVAMLAFVFDRDGTIHDVIGTFEGLREPSRLIPPEIVRLTGLTDELVKGMSIDPDELRKFVEPASLVIAHNAVFDRPFCENLWPCFEDKAWACSLKEIDWRALGHGSSRLGDLLRTACGLFHDGHRALTDVEALLEVLATRKDDGRSFFEDLLVSARRTTVEISAERAPFSAKDGLKERGYRWGDGADGRPRCWRITVGEVELEAELHFLRTAVYGSAVAPPVRRLRAFDRYRRWRPTESG